MRDDQIRYEALRRRVARRVRRRLWLSLLWHTGLFIVLNSVAWPLWLMTAPWWSRWNLFPLSFLWLGVLFLHFVIFISNWATDLMREWESWREMERMVSREDDSWVREREKVKRDFARLSDDGELEYYEDDALYHKRRADAE
jgi:hypothetical protein